MQKGDFVTIDYVAKVKDSDQVFDTTIEEVAKKEDIHTENARYGPVTVVLGEGHVISGLEEALLTMDPEEEREVDIVPEKAFGIRDASKVTIVPLREFRKHNLLPRPGMRIEINEKWATVKRVSSGRVVLDFNHPLAGKELHYSVSLLNKVEDTKEKIEAILRLLGVRGRVVADDSTYTIQLEGVKRGTEGKTQRMIERKTRKYIPGIQISFS